MRPDGERDAVAGPESGPEPPYPLKLNGKVIKGFGRGSSEVSGLGWLIFICELSTCYDTSRTRLVIAMSGVVCWTRGSKEESAAYGIVLRMQLA